MPIPIRYVRSLEEVVAAAEAFLRRQPGDFFSQPRIVVPTAGVKTWLSAALATRLGATKAGGDGIIAGVEFLSPGALSSLLAHDEVDTLSRADDPWEVERLAFRVLEVIARDKRYASRVAQAGGPLLAARRIADRFDHAHFRRPGMILAWEEGRAELSPAADDQGRSTLTPLSPRDRWQFELWRSVRELIGQPSPPARDRLATTATCDAVLVAGLQSLSLQQIELLTKLVGLPTASGSPRDVEAVLVHPSPLLCRAWAADAPPVSLGVAPTRREVAPEIAAPDSDPFVSSWLRGTRETQWLLASQGIAPQHTPDPAAKHPTAKTPLLARLQHSIATGHVSDPGTPTSSMSGTDQSLLIHRCHDLSRQAEVLHDAILHAFHDLDDLAAHEVVIVSPQIAALAPHLEATFHRAVTGKPDLFGSVEGDISLPLVVADRGIRDVSPGAELLAALLHVVGSRCSVDSMLAVATHPLVRTHLHLDDDAVATWRRCIEQTRIRWGLDAERRVRAGLEIPELSAHSWRLGLERMLLGAVTPDGVPEPLLGDVVPLAHVEAAEVTSLASLVSVFTIIDTLDQATATPQPVGVWCDLLEESLASLAGDVSDELEIPLHEIDSLRKAAFSSGAAPDIAVPYHDVKTLLTARLSAPTGQQPLLTGAITATSMIPLRGIPYRVVCVAGFDESAMNTREHDAEDLSARQELLGDLDSRLELRRGLLDGLLAAKDRLIVACTGMDVKNNATLPLVTPLAELVDFAGRHGVPQVDRQGESHSAIEVFHPRHACSRRNFLRGGVVPGDTAWSHDTAAQAAAEALRKDPPPPTRSTSTIDPPCILELDWLAEFLHDPLWPYVAKSLDINVWRDDDLEIPATLPLELEPFESRRLRNDYIDRLIASEDRPGLARAWAAAVRANGDVPVLGYGGDVIDRIQEFAEQLLIEATAAGSPLEESVAESVHFHLAGVSLGGTIERWHPDAELIVLVRPDAKSSDAFHRPKLRAVTQLLAMRAAGHAVQHAIIFSERDNWFPGKLDRRGKPESPIATRKVILDDGIDAAVAKDVLGSLCRLYQQAAVQPHGLFATTAAALRDGRDAAEVKFDGFVSGQSYAQSKEAVVHGLHPRFWEIFPVDDSRLPFFSAFLQFIHCPYCRSRKVYVYSAPAHTA